MLTSLRNRRQEETLQILDSYKKIAGISRLAELTGLDYLGIPVFTAIRPLSKSLTTSQGKGIEIIQAKCSALMESIEVFYAEEAIPDIENTSINQLLEKNIPFIHPNRLNKNVNFLDNEFNHNWVKAKFIFKNEEVLLPFCEVSLNTTREDVIFYSPRSTGIAGGNNYEEALLHSACEVIERNSTNNLKEVTIASHPILDKIKKKINYKIYYIENKYNLPCFECQIKTKSPLENQMIFYGSGCHVDKDIALNRAITEAIQSRLTAISGSRDDLDEMSYSFENLDFYDSEVKINYSDIPYLFLQELTVKNSLEYIYEKIKFQQEDLVVFKYIDSDIVILKSMIVSSKNLIHE